MLWGSFVPNSTTSTRSVVEGPLLLRRNSSKVQVVDFGRGAQRAARLPRGFPAHGTEEAGQKVRGEGAHGKVEVGGNVPHVDKHVVLDARLEQSEDVRGSCGVREEGGVAGGGRLASNTAD